VNQKGKDEETENTKIKKYTTEQKPTIRVQLLQKKNGNCQNKIDTFTIFFIV
jgi:hypothetical protein